MNSGVMLAPSAEQWVIGVMILCGSLGFVSVFVLRAFALDERYVHRKEWEQKVAEREKRDEKMNTAIENLSEKFDTYILDQVKDAARVKKEDSMLADLANILNQRK